jgi:hypothetical protein
VATPYPAINAWVLPKAALEATVAAVRPSGRLGNESGVFWIGDRAAMARVSSVIHPEGLGVDEHPGEWRVSPEVFGIISRWVKERGQSLLGIAHIHGPGVPPRLSRLDRKQSVQAPGVLSVVIGNGGTDEDLHAWGWYVCESGDYRRMGAREIAGRLRLDHELAITTWTVDLNGVREGQGGHR